jgi:protoporphyrinogen oxidase
LTALAGGMRRRDAVDWPEDRLVSALAGELARCLDLAEAPELLAVARWPRAVPQPGREHPRLVSDLRARLARYPRLALAGAGLDGVAFGDALASGVAAARAILAQEPR